MELANSIIQAQKVVFCGSTSAFLLFSLSLGIKKQSINQAYIIFIDMKSPEKSNHIDRKNLGSAAEEWATAFLCKEGYMILERNFRSGKYEVDIIAKHSDAIIGIEVKFRTTSNFGNPEDFVTSNQQERVLSALADYAIKIGFDGELQFDIVGITINPDTTYKISHFKNLDPSFD